MQKLHSSTARAAARLAAAKEANTALVDKLAALGYVVDSGSMRFNRYKVYIYTKAAYATLRKNQSSDKASYYREFYGKYKDIAFTSEVKLIENENSAIRSFLYHYELENA